MKLKKLFTRSIIAFLICVFPLFNACDSGIDISKASVDDILLPGSIPLPLATLHLTVADFLQYFNDNDLFSIDTTGNTLTILVDTVFDFSFRPSSFNVNNFPPLEVAIPEINEPEPIFWDGEFELNINPVEEIGIVERIDSVIINNLEFNVTPPNVNIPKLRVGLLLGNENFYHVDAAGRYVGDIETKYIYTNGTKQTIVFKNVLVKPTIDGDNNHALPVKFVFVAEDGVFIPANTYKIEYSITGIDLRVAYGALPPSATLFGQHETFNLGDLSFLKGFNFYNPQVSFDLTSNLGAYFKFIIDSISTYNSATPKDRERMLFKTAGSNEANSKSDTLLFDQRALHPDELVYYPNFRTYNRENGRVDLIFQNQNRLMPNRLDYSYSLRSYRKQVEDHPELPFFIVPEAKLKINLHVKVPLHFDSGSEVVYNNHIKLGDLSVLPSIENIKLNDAQLKFTFRNGLPASVNVRITEFIDTLGNVMTTGFTPDELQLTIPGAAVNADNGTVNTNVAINEVPWVLKLDKQKYEAVRQAKKMTLEVIVNRSDNKQINFQPSNFLEIKVDAYVDIEGLTTKDLGIDLKKKEKEN